MSNKIGTILLQKNARRGHQVGDGPRERRRNATTARDSIRDAGNDQLRRSCERGWTPVGTAEVSFAIDENWLRIVETEVEGLCGNCSSLCCCATAGASRSRHLDGGIATPTGHPILALAHPLLTSLFPAVDGKTHTLADYAASPFCHRLHLQSCPIAQMYEQRFSSWRQTTGLAGSPSRRSSPTIPRALRIDETGTLRHQRTVSTK